MRQWTTISLPIYFVVAIQLVSFTFVSTARALLIDFESPLPVVSDNPASEYIQYTASITVEGFVLIHTATSDPPGEFRSFRPEDPRYSGSTALFARTPAPIILAQTTGAPFDLVSIDIFEHPNLGPGGSPPLDPGDFPVTFTANRSDGSVISNTFIKDAFLTLQTFSFSGFNDIVSATWTTGHPQSIQFDNIVITAVPEPPTLARISHER